MKNQLESLKAFTTVVADTGDIEAIRKYQPTDATTNPSLLLKAAKMEQYAPMIDDAIRWAKDQSDDPAQRVIDASDQLAVNIGREILTIVPGRISTEVDARLSYDTDACITRARKLVAMYQEAGVTKDRILIKLAATWEGIKAAEQLERDGINTNLTLLFGFAQARACAEANVYLISPFVGRILDWFKANTDKTHYLRQQDPGVKSVTQIYHYFKEHGHKTVVMGASFRNVGEIIELAGCDRLTIGPDLLEELSQCTDAITPKLIDHGPSKTPEAVLSEAEFRSLMQYDQMATEKLAEGIQNFSTDQDQLELMLANYF